MQRPPAFSPLFVVLLAAACGDSVGRDTAASGTSQPTGASTNVATEGGSSGGEPTSSGTSGTGTSDTAPTGTAAVTGSSSSDSGPKFDIPQQDAGDGQTTGDSGCSKVDFLFVIDNSASMEDNQDALIASFPGFIDTIKNTLTATDYHIMVVDTDDDGRCAQPCVMDGDYQEYCSPDNFYICNAQFDACDTTRGAGVVHPAGLYATNMKCPIWGNNRYMLPDEPDLLGTFACVAKVGTSGNPSERPMNGMQEALTDMINAPGGCNAGFLRDDAILVITIISDDPNYEDMGTPPEWKASVVAAKNGDEQAVVIAGLIPKPDMGCGGNGEINGQHWQEFLDSWGAQAISGSVCEPDYAPFFQQAVAIIDETCDNFIPPG